MVTLGFRALAYAGASLLTLAIAASPATGADTIAINTGHASLSGDGSLTSFTIASDDSQFTSEYHGSAKSGFSGGSTVDFSTSIPFQNGAFHPLAQKYHGQQFQAWVTGALNITAKPFVAPHANGDGSTFQTFSTTFTMTGTVTAYATQDLTDTPLFTTELTGSGTVSATYRVVGDEYVMQDGGEVFRFLAPTPSGLPSPWGSDDIGAVGQPGGAIFDVGDFIVTGAGADIWGTSDSFHFVSQPIGASVDVVARLRGQTSTQTFAKAGLMIRGSVAPDSWHVVLDMRPERGLEFMARPQNGATTTFIAGGTSSVWTVWLKLSRRGDSSVSGYWSTDGVSWSLLGSVSVPGGAALAGLAVTNHDTTATNNATFDNVAVKTTLPAGWTQTDVGAVGLAGGASEANGVFTVSGAGSDIWGAADSFSYLSTPLEGDGSISARALSEQNTHPFAKAGIAFGLASPSSAGAILDIKPDGGIEFMARFADGEAMSYIGGVSVPFPVSLKIARAGDTFTGTVSPDGATWSTVASVTLSSPTPGTMAVGLAVTSHDPTVLNTAMFDRVSATPATTSPPQSPTDIVIYASDIPDSALHGTWTRASDPTSPQNVKIVTPDNGVMTAALASPTDYVDVPFNAIAGTPYTLWLRLQALNNSKFNDSVWVQFSDAVVNGGAAYPIGSADALLVNLASDAGATSVNAWGWQNTAYWLSQATTVTFAASGSHTLRIQVREDGVQFDQIVLSPARFRTTAPGGATNDGTIVPR